MAAITAKMVNELRAKTGVGMMDCKKALVESTAISTKPSRSYAKRVSARQIRRLAESLRKVSLTS